MKRGTQGALVTYVRALSRETNADIKVMYDCRRAWDEYKRRCDPGRRYSLGTMAMIAGHGLPLADWLALVDECMNLEPLPVPQAVHPMVGQQSPWGRIDDATELAPGIVSVSTGSHGGIHLDAERNAMVPMIWQYLTHGTLGVHGWYEEDCDWSMVALTYPALFSADQCHAARATFNAWLAPKLKQEA